MVMIHGRVTDVVPQFVSGFSTMNKRMNFSQLICFNNVKGLKEYACVVRGRVHVVVC